MRFSECKVTTSWLNMKLHITAAFLFCLSKRKKKMCISRAVTDSKGLSLTHGRKATQSRVLASGADQLSTLCHSIPLSSCRKVLGFRF